MYAPLRVSPRHPIETHEQVRGHAPRNLGKRGRDRIEEPAKVVPKARTVPARWFGAYGGFLGL